MPTTPSWAAAEFLSRNTGNANLVLATVRHYSFENLFLVNNPVSIVSRGTTFLAAFFEISLLNDDSKPPRATFKFPNVDPVLGQKISGTVDPIEITLEVVSSAHLNEPIYQAPRLQLMNPVIAKDFITGDLMGRDWSAEPLGTIIVTPANFPALFRRRT